MLFENHRKVSFNIASEVSNVYILSGQKLICSTVPSDNSTFMGDGFIIHTISHLIITTSHSNLGSCTSSGRANSGPIIQAGQLRPGQLRPVPIQACPNSGRAVLTQAGAISGPSQFRPSCPNSGRCHFRPIPIQANPIPSQANLSQFRSILYQA